MWSEPVSRVHTAYEQNLPPNTQFRSHPFAYNAQNSLPLAAFAGEPHRPDMGGLLSRKERETARPDSDLMSRGAGLRHLSRPQEAVPGGVGGGAPFGEESRVSGESPGAGTFGKGRSEGTARPNPAVSPTSWRDNAAHRRAR